MDSFFVAVERLKNPALNGLPVVVGGDPKVGRTIVLSASYEARKFGIYSAMPMRLAVYSCSDLIVVSPDFDIYKYYQKKIQKVLQTFSPIIEMTSIDEGYIDLSGTARIWGSPMEAGERLRWAIKQATQLDCTVGIASTKIIAKIASQDAKPSGMLWIPLGSERIFLAPLSIERIPGVGKKMVRLLKNLGLERIHQIASTGELLMAATLGPKGGWLWRFSIGGEKQTSFKVRQRKSFSKEITFESDTTDLTYLLAVFHMLIEQVCYKLRKEKKMAKRIEVKIRYEDFRTINRSITLIQFENRDFAFFIKGKKLLLSAIDRQLGIRLIGVKLSQFIDTVYQTKLFKEEKQLKEYTRAVAIDCIRKRFGFNAVFIAESLYLTSKE
ncbi:MAG: DNA polymerase IV [SAR202 cluster bacterium]|nr:DNA polymerase IV [SAR202 cluster bacterium]|tara:strand:- start:15037 stop:16185 length:1149 start_codon:yes stop_codon:yes gene_type:complete